MNDLISRQAAIDGKIQIQLANGVEIYSDEAVPVEYLKRLPTIDAVPKNDYKKALDCILAAYLNPEMRNDILEKFVFETFSVGEVEDEKTD